jgi:hypothetical protein
MTGPLDMSPEAIAARRAATVADLAARGLVTVGWRNLNTGTLSLQEPAAEPG